MILRTRRLFSSTAAVAMTKGMKGAAKNAAGGGVEIDMMTAASFLHKYEQTGGTKLEEVREQLGPAGPFRIKLIQKLPPSAPEGSTRKREAKSYVGEGEGSSAKEARNMARINLVKRLFGVLKMPHSYLPKDKQAQKAVPDKEKPLSVSAAKEKVQSCTEASSTAKKKAKTANAKTKGETSGRRLKNKPKKEAKKTVEASKLEVTKKTQNELFAADTVICGKVEATEPVTAPLEAVGKDDIQTLLFPKTPIAKLMPNAVNVTSADLKKLATTSKQKSNVPAATKQKPNMLATTKQKAKALTTLNSPVETVKIDVKIDQKAVDPKASKKVAMREKRKKMAQNKENVLCTTAKLTTETLAMREEMTDLAMQLEAMDLPMQAEYKKRPEEDSHCCTFQDRSHYVDALQDVSMFGDLPIRAFAREILRTIEGNQVTVISAATGSGKTTQVPQYILELYKQNRARTNVIVTQPRRIAAISIAKRVAAELKETLCKSVGYSVRFDNKIAHSNNGSSTVNLVTAGILLKMLQGDPLLKLVTHLILDEVHERDLFTDTLLLIIKQRLLEKRPDLKVILMSATLSSEKLIKYFEGSGNIKVGKVLEIAGTNYPIASYYLDDIKKMCPGAEEDAETREYYEAEEEFINPTAKTTAATAPSRSKEKKCSKLVPHNLLARMIAKIDGEGEQGGILVFLPGWEEMMNVMKHLAGRIGPDSSYRVYLLHSTGSVQCDLSTGLPLPEEDTADVFSRAPPGIRKIVLATNIAESSVTIPDVVHVIDSGKQKIIYYDSALRINCLQMAWASKANTKQRMGRAGRCQPGKYYAVMCEKRFEGLLETIPPEIARLDLAEAALGIKASGLEGDLPSILRNCCDPPEEKLAQMAAQELVSLGAFRAEDHSLTPLGRALARFPIHPRLSRMLLTSILMRCSDDIISTVATIGERPYKPARTDMEKTQLRRSIKALVEGDEWGDHLMLTNVLEDWKSHYFRHPSLSFTGLKKMHSAKMQYEKSLENTLKMSLLSLEEDDDYESVEGDPWKVTRFVLSTGFYPDIAVQWRKNIFWAIGMPQVKLLPVSCEYEVSALSLEQDGSGGGVEAGLQDIQSILMRTSTSLEEQNKRVRPKFYVFEELMDTGSSIKSMRRVTAIDPLFLVLSANNVKMTNVPTEEGISNSNSSSSGSGSDKGAAGLMMIDDFIRLEVDRDTAGLMLELRALWKQILAVGIPLLVHGQREPLIERASTLVRSIVRRESDIFRRTKHDLRKQQ